MIPGATRPIRVLVVDDAATVRRLVTEVLEEDAALQVAGAAANGTIALAKIDLLLPDVVTLDVEMPEMDGLSTLVELRRKYPRLPVIMFSSYTQRGTAATLDALWLGASDYVSKPSGGGINAARETVRRDLIPRIKALCAAARDGDAPRATLPSPAAVPEGVRLHVAPRTARIDAVVIGASTGGPEALAQVLGSLPADFPVPVLIVQHMPPSFVALLAERFAARIPLAVAEGREGAVLRPGEVWIASGGRHLIVERAGAGTHLRLHEGPSENACRPSVDVLFRSAAAAYGPGALAVVLTGMGRDGLEGARAVGAAGGRVAVQDEQTSVVWGMPGLVARAGVADAVLPLPQIGPWIVDEVWRGRARPRLAANQ